MVDRARKAVGEGAKSPFVGVTLDHPSVSVLPLWACVKGCRATPVWKISYLEANIPIGLHQRVLHCHA